MHALEQELSNGTMISSGHCDMVLISIHFFINLELALNEVFSVGIPIFVKC